MYCTWASGLAVCGPTSENVPPRASTAALPPASLASKYGLPRFFGMKTTFSLAAALLLPADGESLPVSALLHPAATNASARVAPTIALRREMVLIGVSFQEGPTLRGVCDGPLALERLAATSETHARTVGESTDSTRSSPMMMLMTLTVTLSSRSALDSTPISSTPAMTPGSLPRPPKIE